MRRRWRSSSGSWEAVPSGPGVTALRAAVSLLTTAVAALAKSQMRLGDRDLGDAVAAERRHLAACLQTLEDLLARSESPGRQQPWSESELETRRAAGRVAPQHPAGRAL